MLSSPFLSLTLDIPHNRNNKNPYNTRAQSVCIDYTLVSHRKKDQALEEKFRPS